MSSRVKQLKRQLDEAEEECARLTALKRKVQRDLEEKIEHCEVLTHENEQLKTRLRGGAADKQRYVMMLCLQTLVTPFFLLLYSIIRSCAHNCTTISCLPPCSGKTKIQRFQVILDHSKSAVRCSF